MAEPPAPAALTRAARAARFGIDCGDGVRFGAGTWAVGGEYVARLPLQNVTGRSLHLRYTLPRHRVFFMDYPDPLVLPPGVTTHLEVRFRPVSLVRLDDAIVCGCETGTFAVPLTADVAQLAVDVPRGVDFGLVPVAEATRASLRLANVGQLDAEYEVAAPAPFTVAPSRGVLPVGCALDLDAVVLPGSAHKLRGMARVTLWPARATGGGGDSDGGVTHDVALLAHAKYQHISIVSGGGEGSASRARTGAPLLCGPSAGGDRGGGGDPPAGGALAEWASARGGEDAIDGVPVASSACEPGTGSGSSDSGGALLLQWGLVEVDCGHATVSGPAVSGTSDSAARRRDLRRVVTVVNNGPVGATVSAQRLFDARGQGGGGSDSGGSDGPVSGDSSSLTDSSSSNNSSSGARGGHTDDDPPSPLPFSVAPLTAWLPPGTCAAFTFAFHPHAPGCTPRRTPLTAHFVLSVPGGNVMRVTAAATPVGPCVTIARKSRDSAPDAASSALVAAGRSAAASGSDRSAGVGGGGARAVPPPPPPPPPDVAAGVRATVCFGDVPVGVTPRTQVLVLTNHSAHAPAHWAAADCEAGCGVFLLSPVAGILAPAASSALVVTFAPPLPGGFYRRLTFLVRDGDPVCADVTGTAFTPDQRPAPLRQWHVERTRRLPAHLRWLGPDECDAALQRLRCAAAEAAGEGARFSTVRDRASLRALASAASAEAERALVGLPCPSADRSRAGTAQLDDLFGASARVPATHAPGCDDAAAPLLPGSGRVDSRTSRAHQPRHHVVAVGFSLEPPLASPAASAAAAAEP